MKNYFIQNPKRIILLDGVGAAFSLHAIHFHSLFEPQIKNLGLIEFGMIWRFSSLVLTEGVYIDGSAACFLGRMGKPLKRLGDSWRASQPTVKTVGYDKRMRMRMSRRMRMMKRERIEKEWFLDKK